eukprot:1180522-Prorocentrum_minimum.AAC.2
MSHEPLRSYVKQRTCATRTGMPWPAKPTRAQQSVHKKYLLAYRAYHTKKAYNTATTKRYLRYIQQHEPKGKRAFLASDRTLARFASHLVDDGIAYNTIKGYLSGIRSAHLERGLPWKE